MNGISRAVIDQFLNVYFNTYVQAIRQTKDIKNVDYPVKLFYKNDSIVLMEGAKERTFTKDTEDKEMKKFVTILKTLKYLCKLADSSEWIAITIKSDQKFYAKFEKGYYYSN